MNEDRLTENSVWKWEVT